MTNWWVEFQKELDSMEVPRKTYKELVYCEDCLCVVGETDECLCQAPDTLEASGCGRTDRPCCGGSC